MRQKPSLGYPSEQQPERSQERMQTAGNLLGKERTARMLAQQQQTNQNLLINENAGAYLQSSAADKIH